MSKKYVFSTLTAPQLYRGANGKKVRIEGGANSPDQYMRTPRGVCTPVTDEQLPILESCGLFNRHKASGFITVSTREADADKVARDMAGGDKSAPDTAEKLAKQGKQAPADGKK